MRSELIMILSYDAFLSSNFKKHFFLTLIRFPTVISTTIIQLVAINDCDNYCDHYCNHYCDHNCNHYCNHDLNHCNYHCQHNIYLNFYYFYHYGTMLSGFGTYGMDSEEVTDGIEHR